MPNKTPGKTPSTNKKSKGEKHPSQTAGDTPVSSNLLSENIQFTLTIPKQKTKKAYAEAIVHMAEHLQLPGFRKGKVPAAVAQNHLEESKIIEHAIDHLLSEAYSEEIQKRKLQPITDPRVHPDSIEKDQDWSFTIEVAEQPKLDLKNYQALVKKVKRSKDQSDDALLNEILMSLLEKNQMKIPQLLAEREANRTLSKLVDQLMNMKVDLEAYLKSTGKSIDQLKQEHLSHAITGYQAEFLLAGIAKQESISVTPEEIEGMIQAIPDEATKKQYETANAKVNLHATLVKQKVVQFLLGLVK